MPHQPPVTQTGACSGAGFGIRLLARLIDVAMGFALGLIAGVLAGTVLAVLQVTGAIAPGWERRIQGFHGAGFGLSLLGGFLYHSLTEGIHGASLGKLLCRIRVVTVDGHPCNIGRSLLRSLAYYWDALFFGLVGYSSMQKSPLNQRYGDMWAKTVVIGSRDLPPTAEHPIWRFFAGFLLGAACWVFMLAAGLIMKGR